MTFAGARRHFARRERWLLAAVLLLAVVAHGTALLGEFVFDDIHSIAANWALQDPAHWWRWLSDPTAFSPSGAMYRPAVLLSLGLSFAIDSAPWIFKLGNVLLHALVAGLAFGWLRELGLLQRSAFAAAALFAVHPLVSEAVNLVSARSELLLFVGLLVALRAHRRAETGGRLPMALASVLGGTALACGSKETAVVLPALMLAQTVFLHRGSLRELRWRRALATVLPALALVLVYLLLRKVLLGEATVTLSGRGGGDPLSGSGRSLATQLFTMGLLLPQALLQMVVPVGLSLDPAVTFRSSCDALVAVGWGSVLLLAALALGAGRGRPLAGARRTGLALAAAVALPWIVIPLNVPLAEHRLYGPLLGLLAIVAPWLPRPGRRPLAFTGLLFVGVVLSNARALDYRDEVELWRQELAQHDTWRGHWGLGAAHIRRQEFAAAVPPLGEAWCRNPNHATLLRNYAEALTATP
ncbi:MAG: hypothetical protein KDE27_03135, partial [Planctomycetes bacterium]|nr:hypothetical protein [Planctomycetota bacterium]